MSKDTFTTLALRCEQATGPDSLLDIDICIAVRAYSETGYERFGRHYPLGYYIAHGGLAPKYSASLDAALTLVPPSWMLAVEQRRCSRQPWVVHLYNYDDGREVALKAATLPNALCAAALRARASQGAN